MRVVTRNVRFIAAAAFFSAVAAAWVVVAPSARAQTPVGTKICLDGPNQLCKTIKTCGANTCTTNYYYYT